MLTIKFNFSCLCQCSFVLRCFWLIQSRSFFKNLHHLCCFLFYFMLVIYYVVWNRYMLILCHGISSLNNRLLYVVLCLSEYEPYHRFSIPNHLNINFSTSNVLLTVSSTTDPSNTIFSFVDLSTVPSTTASSTGIPFTYYPLLTG